MNRERRQNNYFELFHQNRIRATSDGYELLKQLSRAKAKELDVEFMCVSTGEGQLLTEILQFFDIGRAEKWVEVGALTGFSALCMLKGLGLESKLWTCEIDPVRVQFLKELSLHPQLNGRLHVLAGDCKESLISIQSQGPFDGVFIDGAKSDYESNLDWAEKNVKPGGLIIADNIFLNGELFEADSKRTKVMKGFINRLSDPKKFKSILLPSSDGLWVARLY